MRLRANHTINSTTVFLLRKKVMLNVLFSIFSHFAFLFLFVIVFLPKINFEHYPLQEMMYNLYLNEIGGTALEMDVTNQNHIDDAVKKIISEEGRIDVLVNNAGLGVYGAIEDVSMEDIYYQFDVNLFGLARVTKAVLPYMREKESGTIINISLLFNS